MLDSLNEGIPKHIRQCAKHEKVILLIKKNFPKINTTSAVRLAMLILNNQSTIKVTDFKPLNNKTFIRKNIGKLEEIEIDNKTVYTIKKDNYEVLKRLLIDLIQNLNIIKEIDDEDNNEKWSTSQINGLDVYEVGPNTMFQDIREKLNTEGKDCEFRFPFKNSNLKTTLFANTMTLQMIEVYVNTNGENFGFPLKYTYYCPECGELITKHEFEVSSTNNKIKCTGMKENLTENGEIKYKRCNQQLSPDINRTETKDAFIYGVTFKDNENKEIKADAISFISLPKGPLKVVLQKIARPYGKELVFVVDYEPINKQYLELPDKQKNEHYIFTLVKQVDQYIKDNTGYIHYGFLHAKIMMIIQMFARYIPQFKNNFNIALIGEMSSGKSAFAKYWGITLYAEAIWLSVATSISIPKLRGTMETFLLFNKEYRYQAKGLLGEVDLLVIDELKEEPTVKNNLKQYLLENNYDYSKQGSNNQTFKRTAQALITENVDTIHLDKYGKDIKKIYQSDNIRLIDNNDNSPKPAWNNEWDLTLPLHEYDNHFLRFAIKEVRNEYARNQKNWIDGSEIALKQRFYFYLFLGSDKTNKQLRATIKQNSINNVISDNIELIRILSAQKLALYIEKQEHLFKGNNDLEYFEEVDKLIKIYGKRTDARTSEMSYQILKILRIIDGRDYCTKKDLEILQYIIENVDNKIEIADTNEFKINGPKVIEDNVEEFTQPLAVQPPTSGTAQHNNNKSDNNVDTTNFEGFGMDTDRYDFE